MKKIQTKTKNNENISDVIKRLVKRIEDATVDIHEMKSDFKFVRLRLGNVEHNTEITKVDMEKLKEKMGDLSNDMFNRLDDISAQLENFQEDKIIGAHQTRELQGEVDSHAKRITHLEKSHTTA